MLSYEDAKKMIQEIEKEAKEIIKMDPFVSTKKIKQITEQYKVHFDNNQFPFNGYVIPKKKEIHLVYPALMRKAKELEQKYGINEKDAFYLSALFTLIHEYYHPLFDVTVVFEYTKKLLKKKFPDAPENLIENIARTIENIFHDAFINELLLEDIFSYILSVEKDINKAMNAVVIGKYSLNMYVFLNNIAEFLEGYFGELVKEKEKIKEAVEPFVTAPVMELWDAMMTSIKRFVDLLDKLEYVDYNGDVDSGEEGEGSEGSEGNESGEGKGEGEEEGEGGGKGKESEDSERKGESEGKSGKHKKGGKGSCGEKEKGKSGKEEKKESEGEGSEGESEEDSRAKKKSEEEGSRAKKKSHGVSVPEQPFFNPLDLLDFMMKVSERYMKLESDIKIEKIFEALGEPSWEYTPFKYTPVDISVRRSFFVRGKFRKPKMYAIQEEPSGSMIAVIDVSGSVFYEEFFKKAIGILKKISENNNTNLYVVFFSDKAVYAKINKITNIDEIFEYVKSKIGGGGTSIESAVLAINEIIKKERAKRASIVIFSDFVFGELRKESVPQGKGIMVLVGLSTSSEKVIGYANAVKAYNPNYKVRAYIEDKMIGNKLLFKKLL